MTGESARQTPRSTAQRFGEGPPTNRSAASTDAEVADFAVAPEDVDSNAYVTSSALRYITTSLPVLSATIDGSVSDGQAIPLREPISLVHPLKVPSALA